MTFIPYCHLLLQHCKRSWTKWTEFWLHFLQWWGLLNARFFKLVKLQSFKSKRLGILTIATAPKTSVPSDPGSLIVPYSCLPVLILLCCSVVQPRVKPSIFKTLFFIARKKEKISLCVEEISEIWKKKNDCWFYYLLVNIHGELTIGCPGVAAKKQVWATFAGLEATIYYLNTSI